MLVHSAASEAEEEFIQTSVSMGTRQLQKAQRSQQQQLEPHGAYCSESSSENGDVDDNVAFNPFAFLGDGDSQVRALNTNLVIT